MMSAFSKASVFAVHTVLKAMRIRNDAFSNDFTLESVFKCLRFRWKRIAFSDRFSVDVWQAPKGGRKWGNYSHSLNWERSVSNSSSLPPPLAPATQAKQNLGQDKPKKKCSFMCHYNLIYQPSWQSQLATVSADSLWRRANLPPSIHLLPLTQLIDPNYLNNS